MPRLRAVRRRPKCRLAAFYRQAIFRRTHYTRLLPTMPSYATPPAAQRGARDAGHAHD